MQTDPKIAGLLDHTKTLLADMTIGELLAAGADLETKHGRTQEERMALAWICGEIESRYDVADAMEDWADDLKTEQSYFEALVRALPAGLV